MTWITESRSIPEKGFGPAWGMSSSVGGAGPAPSTWATSEPISGDHTQGDSCRLVEGMFRSARAMPSGGPGEVDPVAG